MYIKNHIFICICIYHTIPSHAMPCHAIRYHTMPCYLCLVHFWLKSIQCSLAGVCVVLDLCVVFDSSFLMASSSSTSPYVPPPVPPPPPGSPPPPVPPPMPPPVPPPPPLDLNQRARPPYQFRTYSYSGSDTPCESEDEWSDSWSACTECELARRHGVHDFERITARIYYIAEMGWERRAVQRCFFVWLCCSHDPAHVRVTLFNAMVHARELELMQSCFAAWLFSDIWSDSD